MTQETINEGKEVCAEACAVCGTGVGSLHVEVIAWSAVEKRDVTYVVCEKCVNQRLNGGVWP